MRVKHLPETKCQAAVKIESPNLTLIPERAWRIWCVTAKRPNTPHHTKSKTSKHRDRHLLVGNGYYPRGARAKASLTTFVGRMVPSNAIVVTPCTTKGVVDIYAMDSRAALIRNTGVRQLVLMSDQ